MSECVCVCGGGGGGMVVGSVGRFWFYNDSVGLKLLHVTCMLQSYSCH